MMIRRLPSLARRSISSQSLKLSAPQTVIKATNISYSNSYSYNSSSAHKKKQLFSSSSQVKSSSSSSSSSSSTIVQDQQQHANDDGMMVVDMEALQDLSSQRPTPLRLADMYKYAVIRDHGQRLRNAQFLHRELPIRLAQRAIDLLTLPHGLNQSTAVKNVASVYLKYLQLFESTPLPVTEKEEEAFTEMLIGIMLDRTSIPMDIARGLQEWQIGRGNCEDLDLAQTKEMEDALYRFFTARVGLRFLTEHHILSSMSLSSKIENQQQQNKSSTNQHIINDHLSVSSTNFLGCIQTDCNPLEQVEQIAREVTKQTKLEYGVCPEINIIASGEENNFTYVPHHLQYMVAELLKNSCRATIRHSTQEEEDLHPIRVVIVNGAEDVSIKIADRGGGVPRSTMQQIFKFAHSTKAKGELAQGEDIRGFGLPLCRIYARYFGGELTLKSMEGYGLDAYLYLPRLGESCENLPLSVKASPGNKISMPTGRRAFATASTTVRRQDDTEDLRRALLTSRSATAL
jgi:pyruvate dehydrogenase kinase 2/3/4